MSNSNLGTLFLVATPIGNLKEVSPRTIETLKNSELVACEDTRNTRKLLSHFDIHTKMVTYHNFNEEESTNGIIKLLKEGKKEEAEKLEAINNLTEEDLEQIRERQEAYSEMMREPSVYVNDKDKYSDNQSSGVALVIVGVIIGIGAVLMWAGIMEFLLSQ